MARLITLFTGQWADLPLAELAPLAKRMGYDGLELACWGDHFDVQQALASQGYVKDKRRLLEAHGLHCFAIGNHLVGQAVCRRVSGATATPRACASAPRPRCRTPRAPRRASACPP